MTADHQIETLETLRRALSPLADVLAADGYTLEVVSASAQSLHLRIDAGESACADCLVPKGVFTSLASDRLARAGVSVAVTVDYPADPAPD